METRIIAPDSSIRCSTNTSRTLDQLHAGIAQGEGAALGRALLGRRDAGRRLASVQSFRPRDGSGDEGPDGGRNAERDFHGARWSNGTHRSITDGHASHYRKGRSEEARHSFIGCALMENRRGPVVNGLFTRATGGAGSLGADEAYDAAVPMGRAPHRGASNRQIEAAGAPPLCSRTPRLANCSASTRHKTGVRRQLLTQPL